MSKDWRGLAVVILSTGVALALIIAALSGLIKEEPAPQWVAYLVFTLFGTVVGVVASYVRAEEEHHKHGPEHH